MWLISVMVISFVFVVQAQYEGESCFKGDVPGTCRNLHKCLGAIEDIKNKRRPQHCSFDGSDPVVCCTDKIISSVNEKPQVTPKPRPSGTTTTEEVPEYDYQDNTNNRNGGGCEAISANLTSPKTGQKAWDKCLEYQEKLIYPCEKGVALLGELARQNHCGHNADELIIGGEDAKDKEFPHMALLGYGDTPEWLCGGSVISERFVLTAGHCITSRIGNMTYIAVGVLKRSENISGSKRYAVKTVHRHPKYAPPSKYHDIAIVETVQDIRLDQFVVPACLHVGDRVNDSRALVSGWGTTEYKGSVADILQKVILNKFTSEECTNSFPFGQRLMKKGFDPETQLCYGDKDESKDTCQGDSGGPLQIKSTKIHCMYTIVGVTSFGKACGFVGEPGIYTRVAHYVPWIESIVWP